VASEDLDCSDYLNNNELDGDFRNGFNVFTSARFFYIYELMKHYDLTDVIHIENDVLIYYNVDDVLKEKLDKTKIYIPFDTFNRNIASILYIPDHNIFGKALKHYNYETNDMYIFSEIKRNTNLIENFPIFVSDESKDEEYQFVTQNFDKFKMIFDAAAIGQYLGGIDERNIPGDTRGFVNETCVIKYNNYSFHRKEHENIARPFIMINGVLFPIFNLHIHSKKLEDFSGETLMSNSKKKCIAVLTRGYANLNEYDTLIKRNKHIESNLKDKKIELLFFHEGNITPHHQEHIKAETPHLNMHFINVNNGNAFKKEKEQIEISEETKDAGYGYRHMCSFWFVDFWNFLGDYDFMIRIDEDCFIEFDIDNLFDELNSHIFISGKLEIDQDYVTRGLSDFTLEFMKRNMDINYNSVYPPRGPYTNLFAINLPMIKQNSILKKYILAVDESNNIYSRRWGDLPLWGQAIDNIFGSTALCIKKLRYYHGSHFLLVN
jgi:hypothetical protein